MQIMTKQTSLLDSQHFILRYAPYNFFLFNVSDYGSIFQW